MSDQTPNADDPKKPEDQTPKGTEGEPTPKETPEAGAGTPPAPEEDYKKKFSESTSENQRIMAEKTDLEKKNADLETKLAEKQAREAPSDEELAEKHPEWDTMTDTEKMTIRNSESIRVMKENDAWNADLTRASQWARENKYDLDPIAFRAFCYKEDNKGQKNVISLAKSFVFDQRKPAETPPPVRPGVEPPTGGQAPPDDGKMTAEKAKQIRLSNPKLYKKMLASGQLKSADIK